MSQFFDRKRIKYAIITALQDGPKTANKIAMRLREMKHQGYSFWTGNEINTPLRWLIGSQDIYIISPEGQRPYVYALERKLIA